jgi:Thioredoxin
MTGDRQLGRDFRRRDADGPARSGPQIVRIGRGGLIRPATRVDNPVEPPAAGAVLICCARPRTDLVLDRLDLDDLVGYARQLDLDAGRFRDDLVHHRYAAHVAQDVDSADRSGVAGTPTFFINGRRHDGPPDPAALSQAIEEAGSLPAADRTRRRTDGQI